MIDKITLSPSNLTFLWHSCKRCFYNHHVYKNRRNKISVYGASGKGQALMQFCKIDNKFIDHVFDKSKLKQGRFTPGTNIKIIDPKYISKKKKRKRFFQKRGKIYYSFPRTKNFEIV